VIDRANLVSVQVHETFESTAILAYKVCTGVKDARTEGRADISPLKYNILNKA